ncbi:KGGVGR-motif variant AAA ATPase [Chitinophaga japonensis]|uniref:MinD-like ATPase involved in chromosome partitioning or flagellar assembly n=1 Tax=Chitinophaga japonensis TaxID=104662 RepID=A0A562T2I1_CHIJA|nr:tetratricopeptide repeat protein [Chitinophaga japonensis]TWI87857.1 MinD-like ATPase involved in chromosome partitioning or flagellar assembly [Chitinophaga japonensis]
MKTITFYSYKGGVGRSLALANIATKLAEFGKKVCMLDFDLEAPGLHIKFAEDIERKTIKKGIVDYIYEFSNKGRVPENIMDFVTEIKILKKPHQKLFLIAAGNTSSREYWKKLAMLNWNRLFYEKDSIGVDFFYNLKAQIKTQLQPDFLLIDSRTGITDIAGITMSILADEVVLMAANNRENLDGIGQVLSSLVVPENSLGNSVPKINIVLARIPFFSDPKDKPRETNIKSAAIRSLNRALELKKVDHYKVDKVFVIHSDPELEMQESFKIKPSADKLFSPNHVPVTTDYLDLFESLTIGTITENEVDTFDHFRKAAILFEKALNTVDVDKKIQLLSEAVQLYPEYHPAHFYLGTAYYNQQQYDKALESFDNTTRISAQHYQQIAYFRSSIFTKQGRYKDALAILDEMLKKDVNQFMTYLMLGATHSDMGHHDLAAKVYEKAVELEPEHAEAWNALAHSLRMITKYQEGFDAVYKSLELAPQLATATSTLAELYAATGNTREFFKNFDLALSFGLKNEHLQKMLEVDLLYRPFFKNEKFLSILEKYSMMIDWEKINEVHQPD